ncbi:MAG: class A beta-lactamase-related serine hydrolase [Anaerolineales bacterium]|nr:class A beta-lactamase-related serine hydrolase [Anaerolineales bacterium]
MRNRNTNIVLRGASIAFLLGAFTLTVVSLASYSRQRTGYPIGMTVGGVPVGGLSPSEASQRLLQVYNSPVEINYGGSTFHIDPGAVGFSIDVETMLAAADLTRTGGSFWGGFWDYLWNRPPAEANIPLSASISEEHLREFLQNEISPRYDTPPSPAQPIPSGTTFIPGSPGQTLDVDRAVQIIGSALRSPTHRAVALTFTQSAAARPTFENLEILLKQIISTSDFDGLIGYYMMDLQTGREIHFLMNMKEEIAAEPDVAFTASSTIKLPILTSYLLHHGTDLDPATNDAITRVFRISDNSATDSILSRIDPNNGPIIVSKDMETLGLTSTFISGMFYLGAPNLMFGKVTPGNSRADAFADPDPYSQTTPSEMGALLADLYQCAQSGGGAIIAAFPEQASPQMCKMVIDFLALDKFGALIQGGVPDGALVPHKHGFVLSRDGVMHDISDAGIVYSAGGNFVLSIYSYHPVQNIWDITNPLFIHLTQATYNYFNISAQ